MTDAKAAMRKALPDVLLALPFSRHSDPQTYVKMAAVYENAAEDRETAAAEVLREAAKKIVRQVTSRRHKRHRTERHGPHPDYAELFFAGQPQRQAAMAFGNKDSKHAICTSVSKERLLMDQVSLLNLHHAERSKTVGLEPTVWLRLNQAAAVPKSEPSFCLAATRPVSDGPERQQASSSFPLGMQAQCVLRSSGGETAGAQTTTTPPRRTHYYKRGGEVMPRTPVVAQCFTVEISKRGGNPLP